jgi:hypothetical protein
VCNADPFVLADCVTSQDVVSVIVDGLEWVAELVPAIGTGGCLSMFPGMVGEGQNGGQAVRYQNFFVHKILF